MSFQIFTDYPSWFFLLCLLCGAVYAGGLYFREKKIDAAVQQNWLKYLLGFFRFSVAAILAFLLLNPYMKSRFNETEKPILLIAQDNSSSVKNNLNTNDYKQKLAELQKSLSDNYDVRTYVFGEKLSERDTFSFDEKATDISSALEDIQNLYQNLNVGAIVLASDGIYNKGSNPVYVKNDLNVPYYTIALGDTVLKTDIRINRVQHNNIVYLRDKFSVLCDIEAIFCNGITGRVTLTEILKGTSVTKDAKNFPVQSDHFNTTVEFILEANAPGIRHYRLITQKVESESSTDNNVQDIYVEVLDARQKILLLANAPHPDIAAIKSSIETNQNYEVTEALPGNIPENMGEYNLIILHNLPSASNGIKNVTDAISQQNIPVWFITGSQTSINNFNALQNIVKITASGQSLNQVTAGNESSFNLFTLGQNTVSVIPKLPPLAAPYGQYTISAASQVLFYQRIGIVNTKFPLLVYSLPGSEKVAVLCAENIWKWRLYDYVLNNNQDAVHELVNKTVQYLAAKNDKKQFQTTVAKNVFNENENINIDAELYNDSYELINIPDAEITITDENGREFPYQFTKTSNRYTLNAGFFPEGSYTYAAKTNLNGKELKDNGAFSISPVRLESINMTANHKLLNQLSAESNGNMLFPDQISALETMLAQSTTAKPVLHEVSKTQSLINLRWLFFVILILLGIEWFVRKYNGGY
ncbi:MAG: hypothetical protein H7X71_07595 [Chitinophagales bacterium]|nr:hypothetical protein [Chitinophagales bacterium]